MFLSRRFGIPLALALLATHGFAEENLGTVRVESSTIDDRFAHKKEEISSTALLGGDKIDMAHTENIQQMLQRIPGLTTELSTGDSLKIHIRGVENQMYMGEKPGVAVVIDGVPVFERTGKVNIDMDNIESIRVIKGGASYLFGDDALSGAVIITTKRGVKQTELFGAAEAGSYGYRKYIARAGYANDDLSFHLQASQRASDGYHENSEYDNKYLNGKLQYLIDDSSDLNLGMEYSQREKDSHGTVGGVSEARDNPKSEYNGYQPSRDYARMFDVELLKLFATYAKDFDDQSNLLLSAYMYTDTTEYVSAPQTRDANGSFSPQFGDDDYVYDNHYEQVQRGLKGEYRSSFERSAALLGVDLRMNSYDNKVIYRVAQRLTYRPPHAYAQAGDFKSDDTTDENVYAIYGEYKHALTDALSLTANLRFDAIMLDYEDSMRNQFDKRFNVYSYRLGGSYQMGESDALFANFSTGFRAPTVTQLYAGEVSTYGSTISNPGLKPEHSYNYELGLRGVKGGINYEASLFWIDRQEFIMKSSGNYGDTDTTDKWDNIGGAVHRGAELSLGGSITQTIGGSLAYTYLDAYYTDYRNFGIDLDGDAQQSNVTFFDVTDNEIPRTSAHMIDLVVDYRPTKVLYFMAELNARSSYYADDLNEIEIAGHGTLNLLASYAPKIGDLALELFARVDNVFDKQYYSTARSSSDRNEDGIFDAEDLSITVNQGRSYLAGLNMTF
ncbi:MAG: TonB-dependent receptor [Campylobacterales bacterium]|nr:TonB-dependent receptor [Campylobacterales bacterium]